MRFSDSGISTGLACSPKCILDRYILLQEIVLELFIGESCLEELQRLMLEVRNAHQGGIMAGRQDDSFGASHSPSQFQPFLKGDDTIECPQHQKHVLWINFPRGRIGLASDRLAQLILELLLRQVMLPQNLLSALRNSWFGAVAQNVWQISSDQAKYCGSNPTIFGGEQHPLNCSHADAKDSYAGSIKLRATLNPIQGSLIPRHALFQPPVDGAQIGELWLGIGRPVYQHHRDDMVSNVTRKMILDLIIAAGHRQQQNDRTWSFFALVIIKDDRLAWFVFVSLRIYLDSL